MECINGDDYDEDYDDDETPTVPMTAIERMLLCWVQPHRHYLGIEDVAAFVVVVVVVVLYEWKD